MIPEIEYYKLASKDLKKLREMIYEMTKSQKTISEHLTEQWKKEQLEGFRWYYVKFKTGKIDICWLTEWSNDELGTGGQYFDGIKEENIAEVLAEVPSYDGWRNMVNCACEEHKANIELIKENAKLKEEVSRESYKVSEAYCLVEELKELLKECESSIQYYQETYGAMDLDTYTLLAKLKEIENVALDNQTK